MKNNGRTTTRHRPGCLGLNTARMCSESGLRVLWLWLLLLLWFRAGTCTRADERWTFARGTAIFTSSTQRPGHIVRPATVKRGGAYGNMHFRVHASEACSLFAVRISGMAPFI
ncbi:hypothetical protein GY45DRAFT_377619 [Cubamyces sp. BRFM 1775]|nr:hypothetical protein GY45DRAFT_377619 [Cubamyces sp. BRFM 1775]